ncbi:carbohydrate ABC transporter permease [Paenibacillus ferrarius]|uniref:carbohydrate ABC transporter permease n=1 Tax=Paenibacillus ferrarius TaxID=1469647 RepID=UPI003D2B4CD3
MAVLMKRLKASKVRRSSKLFRYDAAQKFLMVFLTIGGIFMILPLVYIFNQALKPYSELFLYPPRIFVQQPTFSNFTELFVVLRDSTVPVTRYLFNSFIVTSAGTLLVVIVSALCAYPMSKHPFPGRKFIFSVIVLSLMFVPEAMQIPRYVVVASIGVMDTYLGHILPHVAAPVGVFLMKQFMDQMPNELLEASKLDGSSEWTTFVRIVIPICMPAVATISILTFQSIWSDASTSALYMQNDAMKTFPFFLSTITNNLVNQVARQGATAAAGLIMFLPTLIFFLIFQRKVISTMAHSGIK